MTEDLMTVREIARACGRSEETVRRWIWSGKLPATKLGNQLFVRREEVARIGQPTVGEKRASYKPKSRTQKRSRQTSTVAPAYNREEMLAWLERVAAIGREMREKYGPANVSELIYQSHEDDDN